MTRYQLSQLLYSAAAGFALSSVVVELVGGSQEPGVYLIGLAIFFFLWARLNGDRARAQKTMTVDFDALVGRKINMDEAGHRLEYKYPSPKGR